MGKIDKHFILPKETCNKLSSDAKRARLTETDFIIKLINKHKIIEKPDDSFWDLLRDLYNALEKTPEPEKQELQTLIYQIKKKYIYGNNKTLGSKE